MPNRLPIGPILRMASICSRKSSSVSSPVPILAAAASARSASKTCSACSIRLSTSPMPRMRLAIRSGWKTSKSSSFSPVEAKSIGTPVTSRTDNAAPPRASPSSLVSTTPVKPTPPRNASAVVTASWPIIASRTNSTSSGSMASRIAAAIRDAIDPDEVLFVLDAMIGQDAVTTAEAFRGGVGFTGVVLTKLDGDARGGAALSVREVTGVPILFASTGEKLEDFDVFHPDRMASRILGMGDVLSLIEQAEQVFDAERAEAAAAKIGTGELTLEDFLEQMLAIRKMGPIGNLLGMLPGAGQMKEALAEVDDKQLDRLQAIIRGMTPQERADPKIINASRRLRIANGSGVAVSEVNQLVDRFFEAR